MIKFAFTAKQKNKKKTKKKTEDFGTFLQNGSERFLITFILNWYAQTHQKWLDQELFDRPSYKNKYGEPLTNFT